MNTSAKKQIIPELLAAVLWGILTLWTDRLFFRYDWRTTAFFVYKALFVLLAFLLVHGIVTLVKKLRAKDRFVWRWLQWTLPYLAVNLIVLLIVWPGCWGNDDLNVLSLARTLQMDAWQHFLTSSAFILSLMFVPIPGGVVLIQNLLISAAVGCFAATAQDLTEKRLVRPVKPVWLAIVYLPFLLPPVLMHNQNPFRTTWSCWCELFLVFMLVAFYLRGTRLTRAELTAVVVLGALAASWRSECVYYLAAIPVMLAVLCCKKLLRPLALGAVTALILCGYMASSRYTSSLMGEAWQYQRIALCYQMAALVQDADPAEDAAELAAIDKIYDVDYCRSHPEIHGNALREAILRNGGSDAEWKECRGAIARLALRYPKSLLRERLDVFNNTLRQRQNGRSNQKIVFASSFLMYEGEPERDVLIEFLQDSAAVKPLNQELRKNFIINVALSGDFAGGLIDWTWWMLPPFVLLFAACLVLLVRRRWMLLFAAGTFFVRIPLVFLTAPDTYFLYYLTPFIAGYAVTAAGIIYAVMKDKRKRERVTD